jgi:hypothetical protein
LAVLTVLTYDVYQKVKEIGRVFIKNIRQDPHEYFCEKLAILGIKLSGALA